jgi:hypothetical protein
MCNLATEMAPLEVWDIETSSKNTRGVNSDAHSRICPDGRESGLFGEGHRPAS